MCGTQTCTALCGWGGCAGEGVCTPGQTDFQNCPQGGVKQRSCQSNCQWGSWSSCPYCGDGQCNGSENQSSCCQDCGCSGGKKCVSGNCCTDGDNDGYYTDCSPYDCSGKDNDKDIYPSASEKLDYKDNDCDGKIDETHRQTLYRRQGSNGFGYTNPGVDADHCWSDSQSGSSCMHNWNTGWAKYQYDGKQIQVYKLSIGSSTEKYVGNVLLARLAECYHPSAHEHQYWTTDSSQYQNLKNAGWQCGFVGYVRTGSLVGQDSKEISVRRHYHSVASDTMYSKEVNEGSGVGFSDKGTAWFAWEL